MKLFHTGLLLKIEECQKHLNLLSVPLLIDVNSCEVMQKFCQKIRYIINLTSMLKDKSEISGTPTLKNQQVLPPK